MSVGTSDLSSYSIELERTAVDAAVLVDVFDLQLDAVVERRARSRAGARQAVGKTDLDRFPGGRAGAAVVSVLGAAVVSVSAPR